MARTIRARRCRRRAAAAAALTVALFASACGEESADSEPAEPGESVSVDGVAYDVRLARQLNPTIAPDDALYTGDQPKAGRVVVGVFLRACNEDGQHRRTATLRIHDRITGRSFGGERGEVDPAHAYEPVTLAPRGCVPREGSPARGEGALAVFELPREVFRNRQLLLGLGDGQRIELDL